MNNEFIEFYECECYSHVLGVRKFHDEPQVYLDKYQHPDIELTFIQRVKLSIGYIFKPEKFDIRGDIILSKDNARKLGEDLMKLTSEKPNNMEFGKTGRLKKGDILKVTSVEKGKPSICDEIEYNN